MKNVKEKTYRLFDGCSVSEFLKNGVKDNSVELVSDLGERVYAKFLNYGQRYSDCCYYCVFEIDDKKTVMRLNCKYDYLTVIGDAKLTKKIIREFEMATAEIDNLKNKKSLFTGSTLTNFFFGLLVFLSSLLTLGLAYPAVQCKYMQWKVSHTWLDGKNLVFTGKCKELYKKYILWFVLSIITLGIYYLIKMRLNLVRWETIHTHTMGNEAEQSEFDGKWYQLFGVSLVSKMVTWLTLTIGYFWAHCYLERWYAKHSYVDGVQLNFNGTGFQFFCKCIVWRLLTLITLGIYAIFKAIKIKKWTIKHTHFTNPELLSKIEYQTDGVWIGNIRIIN